MATNSRTDRMKETIRHAEQRASSATRDHVDAMMRDESKLFNDAKAKGASCSTCLHKGSFGFFTLCKKKYNKQVNPLALCHKWAAKES